MDHPKFHDFLESGPHFFWQIASQFQHKLKYIRARPCLGRPFLLLLEGELCCALYSKMRIADLQYDLEKISLLFLIRKIPVLSKDLL